MDPRIRMGYFRRAKFPEDEITSALDLLRALRADLQAATPGPSTTSTRPAPPTTTTTGITATAHTLPGPLAGEETSEDEDPLTKDCLGPARSHQDPLDIYLDGDQSERETDPLEFWANYSNTHPHRHDYLMVAELARALLAAPATEASSERAFSLARRELPWNRYAWHFTPPPLPSFSHLSPPSTRMRLAGKTLRAAIVLKSFIDNNLPLPSLSTVNSE